MMKIFTTYLYEILKGTKPAALVTAGADDIKKIEEKLIKENIEYVIFPLEHGKYNVFFGDSDCISIIKKCLLKPLEKLDPFEDYILGTLLGYDTKIQAKRLLKNLET